MRAVRLKVIGLGPTRNAYGPTRNAYGKIDAILCQK